MCHWVVLLLTAACLHYSYTSAPHPNIKCDDNIIVMFATTTRQRRRPTIINASSDTTLKQYQPFNIKQHAAWVIDHLRDIKADDARISIFYLLFLKAEMTH